MTFLYRYQTHEGKPSEGRIVAPSEAEAYSALRKSGIRPMKVWPAPGLANRLARLGKRGWSLIVLGALCLVLGAVALRFARRAPVSGAPQSNNPTIQQSPNHSLPPAPRQQLPPVDVKFKFSSEAALAAFARPGDLSCLTNLSAQGTRHTAHGTRHKAQATLSDLDAALAAPILPDPADSPDAVLLKRIVVGLKDEARMMRATRKGSLDEVFEFFLTRQRMEAAYRESVVESLRKASADGIDRDRLESANTSLRRIGMREIGESELEQPE